MRKPVFVALLLFSLNHAAWGLSDAEKHRLTILNHLPLGQLKDVEILVSGASKFEQPVTQAPASVTIIHADEIKQFGFRTVGEILESVRGIDMNDDLFYQFIGIRGFSRSGDFASRVLVLLDGQRLNDNVYETAPFALDFLLDVDLIKRVEFIRGPASAVYGPNAIFGIINIMTKNSADMSGAELKLSIQDDRHAQGRLSYGGQWGDADMLVSLTRHAYPGRDIYYPAYTDNNNGIANARDAEDSFSGFFKLNYRNWQLSASRVKRDKGIGNGYAWTLFNSDSKAEDTHTHLALSYANEFSNALALQADLRYDKMDFFSDYIFSGAARNLDQALDYNHSDAAGQWWTAELSLSRYQGVHRWLVGMEYQYNQIQQRRNYYSNPYEILRDTPRQNSYQWAIFAQDDIALSNALSLSATVRYDAHSDTVSTVSPRLALIYRLTQDKVVKLLFGKAFRSPTPFELANAPLNQHQEAEHIRSLELTLEHRLNEDLQALASLYKNRLKDVFGWKLNEVTNEWYAINTAAFTARGLELALQGSWQDAWNGRISYAYQDIDASDPTQVHSNAPQHLFKLNLGYRFNNRYSLGWRTYYNSSRDTGTGPVLPDYSVSHLSLLARPWRKNLELAAHIYNIFDANYVHPADFSSFTQLSMPQAGRTLGLSLSYRFQ